MVLLVVVIIKKENADIMKNMLGVFIILFVLMYSPLIYSQEYIKLEDGFEIIVIKDSSCLYTVSNLVVTSKKLKSKHFMRNTQIN